MMDLSSSLPPPSPPAPLTPLQVCKLRWRRRSREIVNWKECCAHPGREEGESIFGNFILKGENHEDEDEEEEDDDGR